MWTYRMPRRRALSTSGQPPSTVMMVLIPTRFRAEQPSAPSAWRQRERSRRRVLLFHQGREPAHDLRACGRQVPALAGVVPEVIELDRRVPSIQVATDGLPVALDHRLLSAVTGELPEHELARPLW